MKKFYASARLFLWCALIFYLSSVPHLKTPLGVWDLIFRKTAHAAVYAILLIFARAAFTETFGPDKNPSAPWYRRPSCLWPVLFSIMYAVSDEYHQSFVPGRAGTATDALIDAAGVFAALKFEIKKSRRGDFVPTDGR